MARSWSPVLGLLVFCSTSAVAAQFACLRGAASGIVVSAISEGAAKRKAAAMHGWRVEEVKCSPAVAGGAAAEDREPTIKSQYLPKDLRKVGACNLDGDNLGLKPCTEFRSRSDNTLWRIVTDRNTGSLSEIHFRKDTFWIRWAAHIAFDQAGYVSPEAKAFMAGGSVNPRAYLDKRR